MNEPLYLQAGTVVEVIDPESVMVGWRGAVTSPAMWSKPHYKKIPFGSYRVRMEGDAGTFYGDYRRDQLKVIKS